MHRRFSRACLVILLTLTTAVSMQIGHTGASQDSPVLVVHDQQVLSEFPTGLRFSISASLPSATARADVRFSVGTNATYYESTTYFDGTTEPVVEMFMSFQNLGIPTGVDIEYRWRFHTESGETLETEPQTFPWIDNRFDWVTYQSDDTIVFAYGSDEELYLETVDAAQETVERFQTMLDAPARPEPVRIWLYNSQNDLYGSLSPNSREWIGGVSYANFSLIAAVVPEGAENSMLRVIPHEVVHQILADATVNPFAFLPAWFDEGMAGYGQPVGTENFDEVVLIAYEEGALPSVRSMISEWGSDSVLARISYAASYSVVTFIADTMGEEALKRIADGYAAGLSHDDVFDTALGLTVDELDAMWREHIVGQSAG